MSIRLYNRGKLWPTRAQAVRALRSMRRRMHKRLRKRGDTILADRSFVASQNLWLEVPGLIPRARMTDTVVWQVRLGFITQRFADEVVKLKLDT